MNSLAETRRPAARLRRELTRTNPRLWWRALWRMARREAVAGWLFPFAIAAVLAVVSHLGAFSQLDGWFFDSVSSSDQGDAPKVVIVERDASFEAGGDARFARLEGALERLGSERTGYLGEVSTRSATAIIGVPAYPLPLTDYWQLDDKRKAGSGGRLAARTDPAPEYGIVRKQLSRLPGQAGEIDSFVAALAGKRPVNVEYLVRMPTRQSIPRLKASQLVSGDLRSGELAGTVALVADQATLRPSFASPLTPDTLGTSEALFRAYAVHALRDGGAVYPARNWEAWVLLAIAAAIMALLYMRADPKRLALIAPLTLSFAIVGTSWAALQWADKLLPVTALLLTPWLITFQRVLARETKQDRHLEKIASKAVQRSFDRSALREGVRLPAMLGEASIHAGVERSLLFELHPDGTFEELDGRNASLDELDLDTANVVKKLRHLRGAFGASDARWIAPSWGGDVRLSWLSSGETDLFWLHTHPHDINAGKSAHLVRAITASFRELFRWRAHLNARSDREERNLPIDSRVSSAIALVSAESQQVRRGFDTIDTAVAIFHLIGAPLHANTMMQAIYREAGIIASDTSLPEVIARLSELEPAQIDAMIEELMRHGGEMRMPMKNSGSEARTLRLAVPERYSRASDRVLVLEAIDVSDLHRAADLRQAVALFIDLQLRNDLEAILLGSNLASDDRIPAEKLKPVVQRISETARRATERLDEVASLVRSDNSQLVDACYPVDARKTVSEACEKARDLAEELGVEIEIQLPGVSGFTIAEPHSLGTMLVGMLRVVIADTPQGGKVQVSVEEFDGRTHIRVSGGFGIGFGRLLWLITNYEDEAVGEFRTIGEGMAKAVQRDASVSYWGREAYGFGFNINLKRIG